MAQRRHYLHCKLPAQEAARAHVPWDLVEPEKGRPIQKDWARVKALGQTDQCKQILSWEEALGLSRVAMAAMVGGGCFPTNSWRNPLLLHPWVLSEEGRWSEVGTRRVRSSNNEHQLLRARQPSHQQALLLRPHRYTGLPCQMAWRPNKPPSAPAHPCQGRGRVR